MHLGSLKSRQGTVECGSFTYILHILTNVSEQIATDKITAFDNPTVDWRPSSRNPHFWSYDLTALYKSVIFILLWPPAS